MTATTRATALAAALLLLTAPACAFRDAFRDPAAPAGAPIDPPRPEVIPITDDPVREPRFGFVHDVDAATFPTIVHFDDATRLTGDAAREAFAADHPGESLQGDAYVRNPDPEVLSLPAVGDLSISVLDESGDEVQLTVEEWEARIDGQARGEGAFFEPYEMVVFDGEIVEVRAIPVERS